MIKVTEFKLSNNYDDGFLGFAINSRKKSARNINRLSPFIRRRYQVYEQTILRFNKRPTDSNLLKHHDMLVDYFGDGAPSKIKEQLNKRRERRLRHCPYCGKPCKPRILDHFLPKSKWPEFSIFPNNLVNQCESCSSKKGNDYYCDESNVVKFVHPYFFDILTHVRVDFDLKVYNPLQLFDVDIKVRITISNKLKSRHRKRVRLHLRELSVSSYAEKYARIKYEEKLDEADVQATDMVYLLTEQQKVLKKLSPNCWDAALYKSMLNNHAIKQYLINKSPK